jgi:penicillin-binding protein 1A
LALPVWIEYMGYALRNQPVQEIEPPEGVVNVGGEWYFEEYAQSAGVRSVGVADAAASQPHTSEDERKTILDLFR